MAKKMKGRLSLDDGSQWEVTAEKIDTDAGGEVSSNEYQHDLSPGAMKAIKQHMRELEGATAQNTRTSSN